MKNEEKAINILQQFGIIAKDLEDERRSVVIEHCKNHMDYNMLLEMAQWKDEQFKQEKDELIKRANEAANNSHENGAAWMKEQTIEKAANWLEEHTTEYASFDDDRKADWENKMDFIEDFKQAMEE